MTSPDGLLAQLREADPAVGAAFDPAAAEALLNRLVHSPARPPAPVGRRPLRGLLIALTVLVLLVAATVALAATGVILNGSPVRPAVEPSAGTGEGLPEPGGSTLLPLRVPDPAGGLPWGIRLVHTTRGLICLQVARVQDGQLGQLGIDGAFHDDGRFHVLPADVLPGNANSGRSETASCEIAGSVFGQEDEGVDRSAVTSEGASHQPGDDLRDISYGLLGRHALSITYQSGQGERTESVSSALGAYLLVGPVLNGKTGVGGGGSALEAAGGTSLEPQGAVRVVRYRFNGKLCEASQPAVHVRERCPLANGPRPVFRPTRALHRAIRVRLESRRGTVVAARVSFVAPLAVTSAKQEYAVETPAPCHKGIGVTAVDRDVARGSVVEVTLRYPFANACGPAVQLRVLYAPAIGLGFDTGAANVLVGTATIHRPRRQT